jgi:hypothetical protein
MKRTPSRRRYSVEELVVAAYKAARQVTHNRRLVTIIVSKMLEDWLARSDRPDLLRQLQATA